jgi:hypothetical protein
MLEVELTSDLLRIMLNGLSGLSQPALNKIYKDYEEDNPYENEMMRRFQNVMEEIDEKINDKIINSPFSKAVQFHTLFTFFYDLIYGLGTPMGKRMQPNTLTYSVLSTFDKAVELIKQGKLPESLIKVLRGGTGNLQSRQLRLEFLHGIYQSDKT